MDLGRMDYIEEQKNELEALGEIYVTEFELLSKDPPISFSIEVRPQASNYEKPINQDSDEDEESENENETEDGKDSEPCVKLLFEFPPNYPDELPRMEILDSKNLEEIELTELQTMLDVKARESSGTVMVFMLVSDVVEWLSSISERGVIEQQQELNDKQRLLEAEEARKIEGTPVTKQSFMEWKARFDTEILKQKIEKDKMHNQSSSTEARRLTGREMFESDKTLVESDLIFGDLDPSSWSELLKGVDEMEIDDLDLGSCYELSEDSGSSEEE